MLRPNGEASVHDGTPASVTLPAPAPANSFLRFNAFGAIKVAYDLLVFFSFRDLRPPEEQRRASGAPEVGS